MGTNTIRAISDIARPPMVPIARENQKPSFPSMDIMKGMNPSTVLSTVRSIGNILALNDFT